MNKTNRIMEEELDERFKIVCKELKICGIPLTDKLSLTYKVYRVISITAAYLTVVTTLTHSVKNREDVQIASGSLREAFFMILVLWMEAFISFERTGIAKMLISSKDLTWEDLPIRCPETGSRTNAGMISLSQTASRVGVIAILAAHFGALTLRAITGTRYPLGYSAWLPLDLNEFPVYMTMNIVQIIGSIHFTFAFLGILVLYISFVSVICCQLEKAIIILQEIKHEENECDTTSWEKFREFVILHQKVIRFMSELQEVVGMAFFGPFLLIVAILCFTLFDVVKQTGTIADTVQAVDIIVALLWLLYALCAVGSKLSEQSEMLREAVWQCEWVGTPLPFQKSLTIVLTATKEFTLLAGKIIPLSRNTSLQVVNHTYSYLMILLSFTDKSEK